MEKFIMIAMTLVTLLAGIETVKVFNKTNEFYKQAHKPAHIMLHVAGN